MYQLENIVETRFIRRIVYVILVISGKIYSIMKDKIIITFR